MKRLCLPLGLLLLPFVLASDTPPAKAPPPLAITRDERAMLLGFAGRAEAVTLKAQRELDTIAGEQSEYLAKIAGRLGLTLAQLRADYAINLDTMAVSPRAKTPVAK